MNIMLLTLLMCPDGVLDLSLWHVGETNKPRCWSGFCLWFANQRALIQSLKSEKPGAHVILMIKYVANASFDSFLMSDRKETTHSFLLLSSGWINVASNIVVNVSAPACPPHLWRTWFFALLHNQVVFQKANWGCKGEGQCCGKTRTWDGISIFIDRHKPNETNRITLMWFEGHR